MTRIAHIVSTARYLPEHVVTNAELAARFAARGDSNIIDEFAEHTGITQRFYVSDEWVTSDLALPAAREALKRAGRKPEDVDLIIVGTDTPDYITPCRFWLSMLCAVLAKSRSAAASNLRSKNPDSLKSRAVCHPRKQQGMEE